MSRKVTSIANSNASKQLTYYHKNKEKINQQRREKYRLSKLARKQQINLKFKSKSQNTEIKPNNDIEVNVNKNAVKHKKKKTHFQPVKDNNIEILSLEDLINLVSACNEVNPEITKKVLSLPVKTTYQTGKTKRIRPNFKLGTIIRTVLARKWLWFNEIIPAMDKTSKEFLDYKLNNLFNRHEDKEHQQEQTIKRRTLRRYMQKLTDLHWVVRSGNGQFTSYWINPFLLALFEMAKDSVNLCEYASLGLDFFDMLNLPLINILKSKKNLKDVVISFYSFRKDGTYDMFVKEWFRGALLLNFIFEDGAEELTMLPVNLHGHQVYNGLDQKGKQKYRLFEHNCVPVKWQVFDIDKASYFSKQGAKERVNIHFDNSFSLLVDKDNYGKSTPYYRNWITDWEHSAKKFDGCEYLEFNDFSLVEELFKARFVKQKRKQELIEELGLKVQLKGGRGNKKRKK